MLTKARLIELLEAEREAHRLERAEWAKERAELTNKIIAPKEAAIQSLSENGEFEAPPPLIADMGTWTIPPPNEDANGE